ncbi:hypothetical protein ACLB2K_035599 [Fragaria x ananassa]
MEKEKKSLVSDVKAWGMNIVNFVAAYVLKEADGVLELLGGGDVRARGEGGGGDGGGGEGRRRKWDRWQCRRGRWIGEDDCAFEGGEALEWGGWRTRHFYLTQFDF